MYATKEGSKLNRKMTGDMQPEVRGFTGRQELGTSHSRMEQVTRSRKGFSRKMKLSHCLMNLKVLRQDSDNWRRAEIKLNEMELWANECWE